MKVTVKQLARMLMEEKTVLATHHGGEEGTEGYEKDVLSRSWGDDEEADPKLDFVDEARFAELAGIINEAANPMVDEVAAAVQGIVDTGEADIFSMVDKLKDAGYSNANFVGSTDLGLHYVEIPLGSTVHSERLVIISKNSVTPDGDTIIVGPYAIGIMG